jgi:hypothetical protein
LAWSFKSSISFPLFRYACPDLTGKPGYWAKALAERYAESNALIHFYFTANGDVHFGVNGADKGLFFSGLDTRHPLWCMLDLYGNCTAIEMVDMRRSLNNFAGGGRVPDPLAGLEQAEAALPDSSETVSNALNSLELDEDDEDEEGQGSNEVEVPLRFNSSATFFQSPLTVTPSNAISDKKSLASGIHFARRRWRLHGRLHLTETISCSCSSL